MSMDLYGYPATHCESIYSSSWPHLWNWVEKLGSTISWAVSVVVSAMFIICFASVGMVLGAMRGALMGQTTESGLVRGAGVGAISGAVFSIHVFDSSLLLWRSHSSPLLCLVFLFDVIVSLVDGRLVRQRIAPAILNIVLTQMESEGSNNIVVFETRGEARKGLAMQGMEVEKIPKMILIKRTEQVVDGVCCSVCLQELEMGEQVRRLPHCHHLFHLPCIHQWLLNHSSCPLCRTLL